MGKRKRAGRRLKRRTHVAPTADQVAASKIPNSFIFKVGKVGPTVEDLKENLRYVMEPHTARRLKERKNNVLKDYLNIAGPLGVTHLISLSATDIGTYLRVLRTPRGPTLTFRIVSYSLMRDIAHLQQRPHAPNPADYRTSPLVVLNSFPQSVQHYQLASTTLQNMFPPINVQSIKLTDVRRVVLFSYIADKDLIEFRHYLITATPVGLSRPIKKVLKNPKRIPDLSKVQDIADFVLNPSNLSDSEGEDTPESRVRLPVQEESKLVIKKPISRGRQIKLEEQEQNITTSSAQTSVRLVEVGPRMTLQLEKIQEGFADGDVLYHRLIHKTPQEVTKLKAERAKKDKLREQRQKEQEENIRKKQKVKLKEEGEENEEHENGEEDYEQQEDDGDYADFERSEGEEGEESEEEAAPTTTRKAEKRKVSPAQARGTKIKEEDENEEAAEDSEEGSEEGSEEAGSEQDSDAEEQDDESASEEEADEEDEEEEAPQEEEKESVQTKKQRTRR